LQGSASNLSFKLSSSYIALQTTFQRVWLCFWHPSRAAKLG